MRSKVSIVVVSALALVGLVAPAVGAGERAPLPDDIEAAIEQLREVVPLLQEALMAGSSVAVQGAADVSAAGGTDASDVTTLLSDLGPTWEEIKPLLAEAGAALQSVAEAVVAGRIEAAGIIDTILSIIGPLWGFISKLLPTILPILVPILKWVANNLATILPPIVNIACSVLKTLIPSFLSVITGVCSFISSALPGILPFISTLVGFLSGAIPLLAGVLGGGGGSTPTTAKKTPLPATGSPMPLGSVAGGLLLLSAGLAVLRRRSGLALA